MNKNVYFQNSKEEIYNNVFPFFKTIRQESYDSLNDTDKKIMDQILYQIKKTNNFPFKLNSQELLFLQKNSKDKWMDYLIYRYKFRTFPIEKIVSDFPLYVLIEPVSTCNLRCTMCFQIDKTFTKKPFMGTMNMDFFKNIIDDCYKNGTKAITLASRGEPTLHPKLGEMLEYASGKFYELKLNTNATKLNEKLIHNILSSGVNELVYSVDESEKDKFEKLRVNANFEEVLKNIMKFKEIREKHYKDSKTTTRISGVLVGDNQDVKKITSFWEQYVDHVVFVKCQNRWDTYNNNPDNEVSPCNYLWERMYIWFDGIANPCDVDYKSYLKLGKLDYTNNSIRDLWHSNEFKELRKKHLTKQRKSFNPCDRCGLTF